MNNPNFNDIPDSLPTPDPNAMNPVMSAETADTSAATGVASDMEALLAGPAPVNNSIATPARETPAPAVTQPATKEKKGGSPIVAILITLILAGAAGVGGGYFLFGNQKGNTPAEKPSAEQVATTTISEEIDAYALVSQYFEDGEEEYVASDSIFKTLDAKSNSFITRTIFRNTKLATANIDFMDAYSAFLPYGTYNDIYHQLFNSNTDVAKPKNQDFGWAMTATTEDDTVIYMYPHGLGGMLQGLTSTQVVDYSLDNDKLAIKVAYASIEYKYEDDGNENTEDSKFIAKLANGSNYEVPVSPDYDYRYMDGLREALKDKVSELPQYTFNFTKVDGAWKLDSVTKD